MTSLAHSCRPVGFVTFATEQQAQNAQEAYNLWQGFGQGGLLIERIAVPPQQAVERPLLQGPPAKRPPPEPQGVPKSCHVTLAAPTSPTIDLILLLTPS